MSKSNLLEKQHMSLSKQKGTHRRGKNKRTNSEAIDKILLKSQLKKKGLKKMNTKILFSEVFSDLKNRRSKVQTNSISKTGKSKKKASRREGQKMFNTMGTNKISHRKKNLMLSRGEMNQLFQNPRGVEDILMEDKMGHHVRFENRKKSLKILEEFPGIRESLAESGLSKPEFRFKSTKKKIGKAEFELGMKRHSNTGTVSKRKLGASPETKSKKGLTREFNLRLRKESKGKELHIRKKVDLIQRMELELANDLHLHSRGLNSGKNFINSVKVEKQLVFDENHTLFERKSTNSRSQKNIIRRKQDVLKCKKGAVKSKEKKFQRRQSEKNMLLTKENMSLNKPRKKSQAGKTCVVNSKSKKKKREKGDYLQIFRDARECKESSRSRKSKRARQGVYRTEEKTDILKSEAWGLGKKKPARVSKKKDSEKKIKSQARRAKRERELLKKLGESKFQSMFKSQRKATLLKMIDSATEKTLHSGLDRKNSTKLLGNINLKVLSKRKSNKNKNLKSLSKIFRNGILRTKKDATNFLFDGKSKSMKKKSNV